MNDLQRLSEMGITVWDLRRPELFKEQTAKGISLPCSCKLLFVCEQIPTERDLNLFSKILESLKLSPNQALHLPPARLNLNSHALEWCWFAQCEPIVLDGVKCLSSPSLSQLEGDKNAKKQLWAQIKAYDK